MIIPKVYIDDGAYAEFNGYALAQRFMNWYRKHEHKTQWDEDRRDMATAILIQADEEEDPDY